MAPSIYGHDNIKRALALSMFGGEPKNPGMWCCLQRMFGRHGLSLCFHQRNIIVRCRVFV